MCWYGYILAIVLDHRFTAYSEIALKHSQPGISIYHVLWYCFAGIRRVNTQKIWRSWQFSTRLHLRRISPSVSCTTAKQKHSFLTHLLCCLNQGRKRCAMCLSLSIIWWVIRKSTSWQMYHVSLTKAVKCQIIVIVSYITVTPPMDSLTIQYLWFLVSSLLLLNFRTWQSGHILRYPNHMKMPWFAV